MKWFPHDLGTWGFILSIAALLLAIPLGIAATLLASKLQVWWFVRSVRGTANKLISLTEHLEEIKGEPLFSPTETMIFEQQFRLINAVHVLAYIVIIAVILMAKWQPHAGFLRNFELGFYVVPFAILLFGSWVYCGGTALVGLLRSSPKEREKLVRQIGKLVDKLRAKVPPSK
jgi:hypothetical protein